MRLRLTASVGALSVLVFCWYWRGVMVDRPDFDQVYYGALALRDGLNPYDAVGPAGRWHWAMPLYYPTPALVAALPFTLLPIRYAGALFIGLGGAALGYALARQLERDGDRGRFFLLLSSSYIFCVAQGQWSLLFLAAALHPPLNVFAALKPNAGALAASRVAHWRQLLWPVGAGLLLLAVSFAMRPTWLGDWRRALGDAPYQRAPITYPGGVLALLTLARWRRPDARYALAFALIPQTPGRYTDLLLFAIPKGKWETLLLALLTYTVIPLYQLLPHLPTLPERIARYGAVSAVVLLLPCVFMILRRPNVAHGQVPGAGGTRRQIDEPVIYNGGVFVVSHPGGNNAGSTVVSDRKPLAANAESRDRQTLFANGSAGTLGGHTLTGI